MAEHYERTTEQLRRLCEAFFQHLKRFGADDKAYALYRTQICPAAKSLSAAEALQLVMHLQGHLPQEESALCAALRLDEGVLQMHGGQFSHALSALKDACAISARCRDAGGMVEGSLALADCFSRMGDTASAQRSAALCLRAIDANFAGKHPLKKQAQSYLAGQGTAQKKREEPKIDPTLQQPSFVRVDIYQTMQKQEQAQAVTVDLQKEEDLPGEETMNEEVPGDEILQNDTPDLLDLTDGMPEEASEQNLLFEQEEDFSVLEPTEEELPLPKGSAGSLYLDDPRFVVGFSRKNERIVGSSQKRRDVRSSILVGAQNGMLVQGSALEEALIAQIDHWQQRGDYEDALEFLGRLQQALPTSSQYHMPLSLWTAKLLADAGDVQRAIGLYSRIVEQFLQNGQAAQPDALAAMQNLCDLYHNAEQFSREAALRKVVLHTLEQSGAGEQEILSEGEDYLQALLDAPDAQQLMSMCRWYAAKQGDVQLFADALDLLLPLLDEEQNDEAICDMCALAQHFTAQDESAMQDNWIMAWLLACLNRGDIAQFMSLASTYEARLAVDGMQQVQSAMEQCAQGFLDAGDHDTAAEFYSLCLNVSIAKGETQQEEAFALKLCDVLDLCGRIEEAQAIRQIYQPKEEESAQQIEEAEKEPTEEAEETTDEVESEPQTTELPQDADALRVLAEDYEAQGDVQQALVCREKIYRLRMEEKGQKHPDTLAALNNYAKALSAAGNLKDAVLHQLRAVELYAKTLGERHGYTRTAMSNLAKTMERAGQFTEALAVREKVYQTCMEIFPADHPDVQRARKRLIRARKLTTKM
ncbi:MAG: tetratricopeptide repeat protein [Clostridia bacterium]|nr:tetratricopeptide repeat protein [Clostridia bacterium]